MHIFVFSRTKLKNILSDRLTINHLEQYALTEASYTVVRLMQHFDTLENADPHPRQEPIKLSNLTMSHDLGVPIRLYSSDKI